jgi:hypothetical protein
MDSRKTHSLIICGGFYGSKDKWTIRCAFSHGRNSRIVNWSKYQIIVMCKNKNMWLLKKLSNILFPYLLTMRHFITSFLFRLTPISQVQKSTTKSITSFGSELFLFAWVASTHCLQDPSINHPFLFCPLLKILGFIIIS